MIFLAPGGDQPNALYQVRVPIVTNQECAESYRDVASIYSKQICAGDTEEGGVDTCQVKNVK